MSLFYLTVIAPFVLAYGSVLGWLVQYTHSYTVSLVLVALAHILVTAPFRRFAGQLPLELRAPFTLTFHLPFLAAIYYLLTDTPAPPVDLFAFVSNGRQPDRLLGTVNLLPIVALLLQLALVASFPCRTRAGRLPGFISGLILGAALYEAPAYLLVFWIPVLALSIVINLEGRRQEPRQSEAREPSSSNQRLIFGSSLLVLALLICAFGPSMLYFSDPLAYFNQGVFQVLRSSLPIMGLILLSALIIWTIVPRCRRGALCKASSFCATAGLLFASSGFPDYGVIDGFNLSRFDSVTPSVKALVDITTLSIAALITWALFTYKRPLEIVAYFVAISIALVVYPAALSITRKASPETPGTGQIQTALQYSKSGKNTIIFILDMFTGTRIKQLMEDLPETMAKFTGFTWYPDTLAAGNITLLGLPPIVGGHSYVPSQMNANTGATNIEKLAQAHAILPRSFAESGSDISILNVPFYFDKTIFLKQLGNAGKNLHLVPNATEIIYPPNKKDTGSRLYSIAISLFRISPNLLRNWIYQQGMWLGAADARDSFQATKGEVLFLTSLPLLSSTTSPRDTLKVIYSLLPHCYYHLKKDVVEFVEDPDPSTPSQPYSGALGNNISPEHYYTEQHTMRFLAAYFDWLKAQGIYDNTKIILASDHSWFDSRMLSDAFGGNHGYPGRPAGLLMIKDFNATGPLKVSPHFLSTADVPFFACSHIGPEKCEADPSIRAYLEKVAQTESPVDRERTHDVAEQWTLNRHPERTLDFQTYRVRNSMFNKSNWEQIKTP